MSPSSTDREAIDEEGEPDRAFLGIDGTMGDAQDEDHPFLASVYGGWCRVCGLAAAYRRHTVVESIRPKVET